MGTLQDLFLMLPVSLVSILDSSSVKKGSGGFILVMYLALKL